MLSFIRRTASPINFFFVIFFRISCISDIPLYKINIHLLYDTMSIFRLLFLSRRASDCKYFSFQFYLWFFIGSRIKTTLLFFNFIIFLLQLIHSFLFFLKFLKLFIKKFIVNSFRIF